MGNGRILVVEDNPDNMILVEDMLLALGYDVLQAADGEYGMQLACAEMPDLILMDLSLPKIDGWTATRSLKSNPNMSHIPIIALTAHAMVGDLERALEAGCDAYVSKPIDMPKLASVLVEYLG